MKNTLPLLASIVGEDVKDLYLPLFHLYVTGNEQDEQDLKKKRLTWYLKSTSRDLENQVARSIESVNYFSKYKCVTLRCNVNKFDEG